MAHLRDGFVVLAQSVKALLDGQRRRRAARRTLQRVLSVELLAPRLCLSASQFSINELLADPAPDLPGDANGDGIRSGTDDEFVELVNGGASTDIGGWTLADSGSVRHVFPSPTIVSRGQAIVVFGGGDPSGDFGGALVQVASSGALGLNNSGDTVVLSDGEQEVSVVYGGEAGDDTALTRDPDITGLLVLHTEVQQDLLYSPGVRNDGQTPFAESRSASVNVSESDGVTRVSESGLTDALTISLGGEPESDVLVKLAPASEQIDLGQGAGAAVELTFSPPAPLPQTVDVAAIDDLAVEGEHRVTILISTSSADPAFDDLAVNEVEVVVEDDDMQSVEPGDVVLNEIMQNPSNVSDALGEFFELWNTTSDPIDVEGWVIHDNNGDMHTIQAGGALLLPADGFLVLGINADTATNGGVVVDYQYAGITLGNGEDTLVLEDRNGQVIDLVTWDGGATFPDPNGRSMELLPGILEPASANDLGLNWHASTGSLPGGDQATPGHVNSTPALPELTIDDVVVDESSARADFVLSLSEAASRVATVDIQTEDGTAVSPHDFVSVLPATVRFEPGETAQTISVSIVDDQISEPAESFTLQLSSASGLSLLDPEAVATIVDDDTPSLAIADVSVEEGEVATMVITLSQESASEVVVQLETEDDTAVGGEDYESVTQSVTFPPGTLSQQVVVTTLDDEAEEPDEVFVVRLLDPQGATLADSFATVTILANDIFSPEVGDIVFNEVMQNPAAVADGEGEYVELWNTSDTPIDLNGWVLRDDGGGERHTIGGEDPLWIVAGGFFVAGINGDLETNGQVPVDYVYSAVSLGNGTDGIVLESPTGKVIDEVVWDDGETFPDPSGAAMELNVGTLDPAQANDFGGNWHASTNSLDSGDFGTPGFGNSPLGPPEVLIQDATVAEDAGVVTVLVSLSRAADGPGFVDVTTEDGSALGGKDFVATSRKLHFDAGDIQQSFTIVLRDDVEFDPDETFRVIALQAEGATVDQSSATVTIVDDELPEISIQATTASERDGDLVFSISLSGAVNSVVSANFHTESGTATAGVDFLEVDQNVEFAPGVTAIDVEVPLVDDTRAESAETFLARLTNAVGATIVEGDAIGTIEVSDVPAYGAGDVVINEVMRNPSAVTDDRGEFFELWNTTGFDINLAGWSLLDDADPTETHVVDDSEDLILPAGGYLVLGVNSDSGTNGGVAIAYQYDRVNLGNGFDGLTIVDRWGTEIDTVIWDEVTFPSENGSSMELAPGLVSPGVANDQASNWQVATERLSGGDAASAGVANTEAEVVEVSVLGGDAAESAGVVTFTIELSTGDHNGVTVALMTMDGLATAPADYAAITSLNLAFLPGEQSKSIEVSLVDDSELEQDEDFALQLVEAVGAQIQQAEATSVIQNDELPEVAIQDVTVEEGAGVAEVSVVLNAPYFEVVTVTVATNDAEATAGEDYQSFAGTVTFEPGELERIIQIEVVDDDEVEPSESLQAHLESVQAATISDGEATVTILDDDAPAALDEIVINEIDAETVDENREFVELYDGGVGNSPLDGLVLVLFDGVSGTSYRSIDLSGHHTDDAGFFVVGDSDTANIGLIPAGWDSFAVRFPVDNLRNGEDAVGLYLADSVDFPQGTPFTLDGLVDGVVYQTGSDPDSVIAFEMWLADPAHLVYDEDAGGAKQVDSISRLPDGPSEFGAALSSPGTTNLVTPPTLDALSLETVSGPVSTLPLVAAGITGLVLTFDRLVTFDGPPESSVSIYNETEQAYVEHFTAHRTDDDERTILTVSEFRGASANVVGNLLGGTYTVTIDSQVVSANGVELDVDGDGIPGPGDAMLVFTAESSGRRRRG